MDGPTIVITSSPLGQDAPATVQEAVDGLQYLAEHFSCFDDETDITTYFRSLVSLLQPLVDDQTVVRPIELEDTVTDVFETVSRLCVEHNPGNSHRLLTEFSEGFQPWTQQTAKLPELTLTKGATHKEIFNSVDLITDHGAEYPVDLEKCYDALTDPILKWYGQEHKGSSAASSRSQTPKGVRFPENVERTPSPQNLPGPSTPVKTTPNSPKEFVTPVFLPYKKADRGDAIRLAKERDSILRENNPRWDLLSTEEKHALRTQASEEFDLQGEEYD